MFRQIFILHASVTAKHIPQEAASIPMRWMSSRSGGTSDSWHEHLQESDRNVQGCGFAAVTCKGFLTAACRRKMAIGGNLLHPST